MRLLFIARPRRGFSVRSGAPRDFPCSPRSATLWMPNSSPTATPRCLPAASSCHCAAAATRSCSPLPTRGTTVLTTTAPGVFRMTSYSRLSPWPPRSPQSLKAFPAPRVPAARNWKPWRWRSSPVIPLTSTSPASMRSPSPSWWPAWCLMPSSSALQTFTSRPKR